MGAVRSRLRRWHVWLGWIVGIPILLWVVSGLIMIARPIEVVRGTDLLRDPAPIRMAAPPVAPHIGGLSVKQLQLEQRAAGPRWVVVLSDGTTRLADPANGRILPVLSAADAVREVATWRVAMDDGTHFYVDAANGAILARRTGWWRFYDLMWGLHIMDLETREDAHNPLLIGFGLAALVMAVIALIQLPLTIRRRRRSKP